MDGAGSAATNFLKRFLQGCKKGWLGTHAVSNQCEQEPREQQTTFQYRRMHRAEKGEEEKAAEGETIASSSSSSSSSSPFLSFLRTFPPFTATQEGRREMSNASFRSGSKEGGEKTLN